MSEPAERQPSGIQMKVDWTRGVLFKLTHGPSGVTLQTDAPRDNGGEASSFSPTDLLSVSLASCMLTTLALVARRENIPWGATHGTVEKRMSSAPRRVGELGVDLHMPRELPKDKRAHLEQVAKNCPVQLSLHPDVVVRLRFHYDD